MCSAPSFFFSCVVFIMCLWPRNENPVPPGISMQITPKPRNALLSSAIKQACCCFRRRFRSVGIAERTHKDIKARSNRETLKRKNIDTLMKVER